MFGRKPLPMSERMIIEAQKKADAEQDRRIKVEIAKAEKAAYLEERKKLAIASARAKAKRRATPMSQRIGQGMQGVAKGIGSMAGPPQKQGKKTTQRGSDLIDLLVGPPTKPKAPSKTKAKKTQTPPKSKPKSKGKSKPKGKPKQRDDIFW